MLNQPPSPPKPASVSVTGPQPAPVPQYLTKQEAANLMRCSVRSVDRLMQQGRLRYCRAGARILFTPDQVRACVESVSIPDHDPSMG